MRRSAIVLLLALAYAPAARAAPPAVTIQASPAGGPAPLTVTLTASGDLATYSWDLGDGTTALGPVVQHSYAAGRFVARVTATSADGETAQAQVTITSLGLSLAAPKLGHYGQLARFRGRLVPALAGVHVGLYLGEQQIDSVKTKAGGQISLRGRVGTPGSQYTLRYAGAVSNAVTMNVEPGLDTSFQGSGRVGRPLALVARERPANAGELTVQVWRNGHLLGTDTGEDRLRVALGTRRSVTYRIVVSIAPAEGFVANRRQLEQIVFEPNLQVGDSGASVLALEQRLHQLHFALPSVSDHFSVDVSDAVVAFQKLHNLPRTGDTDARFWRELEVAHAARARFGGSGLHVEVSKELQVLFLVRNGKVALIVPTSTGATGNTPVGLWHVYSKVPGYNAKLMYYSSFFVGGFAIHGYADVPTYPASHGCVRIPIWVAIRVYSLLPYGTAVYIY